MTEFSALEERVIEFQRSPRCTFDELLLDVCRYQARHNEALARWWEKRGFQPEHVTTSEFRGSAVPAVPTDVFRHVRLVSQEFPTSKVFRTSGTTSGVRGEHWKLGTGAYDEGALLFATAEIPGLHGLRRLVSLTFSPEDVPDSSLAHMVAHFGRSLFRDRVHWHLSPLTGLDTEGLRTTLRQSSEPLLLFGTAFAFVEALESDGLRPLPEGSIVVETGGYKGRSRELPRAELHRALSDALDVPLDRVGTEYGMTELSSQFYAFGPRARAGHFQAPHWCRVLAADRETLAPLAPGERGLLRFHDLANLESVAVIQTSDYGVANEDGSFSLEGRAGDAVPRGCSLAVEEISNLQGRAGA